MERDELAEVLGDVLKGHKTAQWPQWVAIGMTALGMTAGVYKFTRDGEQRLTRIEMTMEFLRSDVNRALGIDPPKRQTSVGTER